MCVKLPPENLNPIPYPPYLISTYICEVTLILSPKKRDNKHVTFNLPTKKKKKHITFTKQY